MSPDVQELPFARAKTVLSREVDGLRGGEYRPDAEMLHLLSGCVLRAADLGGEQRAHLGNPSLTAQKMKATVSTENKLRRSS